MYTIGEFASYGRVSVRMLRHYDAIGLLKPVAVDAVSGYRHYDYWQFAQLTRILALKDVGVSLDSIRGVIDGTTDGAGLKALLVERRASLAAGIRADQKRLARVDARLRRLEGGHIVPETTEIEIKAVAAAHLAELSTTAGGFAPEFVTPAIRPLYDRLGAAVVGTGIQPTGPAIAYYESVDDSSSDAVRVHAGFQVAPDAAPQGVDLVDLAGAPTVATLVHHGVMATIGGSWQRLQDWIADNGYRPSGVSREFYLSSMPLPEEEWVTELQIPVERTE